MPKNEENIDFLSFEMYERRLNLFESLPITQEAVVFVGDSLTQRNQWSEFFPDVTVVNRGIDSDRTLGVLNRLDHIISLSPKKVFLMIGINDLFDGRKSIINNYEKIIHRVKNERTETRLYIQSLLPVNNSIYRHQINNEDVKKINSKLSDLASENSLTYIDLYPHVLKDNELDEKYTLDGCHLSGDGYTTWAALIKPFVLE